MVQPTYDVIVVGARCAGSSTAMLLARKGYRVLVVDRAAFPSDTISTHLIHPPGVAALRRWGLVERLIATGCPAIHTYSFDFGPFAIAGSPGTDAEPVAYAPRRTVLDKLLVDAAVESGVQVRERFTVTDVLFDQGVVTGIHGHGEDGHPVSERARVVIGADGIYSQVARAVQPEQYNEKPRLNAGYYTYWSNLPMNGRFEAYSRPRRVFAAWPTNDDLTLLIAGWPIDEFEANKSDIEGNYLRTIDLVPSFAARLREARRVDRFYGATVPNYFRKPYGRGWALVGDAGYIKDSITAQGIADAFRDAEWCAEAVDAALGGARPFEAAMADYQTARDAHALPMYEFTAQIAAMTPPPEDFQRLLGAVGRNRAAMDDFARLNAGVISPTQFFSEDNIKRIMAAS